MGEWWDNLLEKETTAHARGWYPNVGDMVRISPPETHPDHCQGPWGCVHGMTGKLVLINTSNAPSRPYYVVGHNWSERFALWEIEPDE